MLYDTNTTLYKQCSSKRQCVNPNGPWLPATLNYFYAQKECLHGITASCKVCFLAKSKQYRNDHREAKKRTDRQYRLNNADKIKDNQKAYRAANKDHISEIKKTIYRKDPQKVLVRAKEWRKTNSSKLQAAHLKWDNNNRDKKRGISRTAAHRRRALKRILQATFTDAEWITCLEYWGYRCAYCGGHYPQKNLFGVHLQQDHYIPLTAHGAYAANNIVPACGGPSGCNQRKGGRDLDVFLSESFNRVASGQIKIRINKYFNWVKDQRRKS